MNNLFIEDSHGVSSSSTMAARNGINRMKDAMSRMGRDLYRDSSAIFTDADAMASLTEAVKIPMTSMTETLGGFQTQDINRVNQLYENVAKGIMNEAIQNIGDLSPIMVNSFGIQERALIGSHLPRAVKQITAKVPDFKLSERIPYIIDLAGTKKKFVDAFIPDEKEQHGILQLDDIVEMSFVVPSNSINLYAGSDAGVNDSDPGYRPAVDDVQVFAFNSILKSVTVTGADEGSVKFGINSLRTPNVENGVFAVQVEWTETSGATEHSATVSGQFDLSNGMLMYISASDSKITEVKFDMVLSPETHTKALSIGYDMHHTPVNIPIKEHYEFNLSEEFKDASEKYYNVDAMAQLTDTMGRAVDQVKDIKVLKKFLELKDGAILKTTFNCTPDAAYAYGKEEYIKAQFCPFMEQVAIILKNKTRITDCHFRVVGNPLDIRVSSAAGAQYIYKRNEQFAGEIGLDYEFSVTSDMHKIFYLSSDRVPVGTILMFLIPNSIEDNISTVNHYEYATYVSNVYRGTRSNLPTAMISTRYLTQEYYPVVAAIDIVNNIYNDPEVTIVTGKGMTDAIRAKVQYVNR